MIYAETPTLARTPPRDPNDTSESRSRSGEDGRHRISRITDRPAAKEACLVVIYGSELGKKYNFNSRR